MKVLLIDDHAPIRARIRELLQLRPEFQVVGEGSNGAEAVERVEELDPDVVLMDVNMPVMNGAEATKIICERHPKVKVLALTAFGDMSLVSAMVQAGASGYLIKGGSPRELLESLDAVARGKGALDTEVTGTFLKDVAELYRKEQERAEALQELDRMKSEFVSVVSHELRTPVTSIKGGVETLRRNWDAIDESVKVEVLDSIAPQCDRLIGMIEKILTVAGIDAGGIAGAAGTVRLDSVVQDATRLLRDKANGRGLLVQLQPVEAVGDSERIREIVAGLIENALNFTEGDVVVEVVDDGTPTVRVSDYGPGIDPATLERLLETPFSQGDSSITRPVGGLGLSLYIARKVLEAYGGRLDVESSPERGSTFAVVLPRPDSGGQRTG